MSENLCADNGTPLRKPSLIEEIENLDIEDATKERLINRVACLKDEVNYYDGQCTSLRRDIDELKRTVITLSLALNRAVNANKEDAWM